MVSVLTAKDAVTAPPATPPRYGLLVAANQINDGARWEQGVRWAPEQNAGGGAVLFDCHGQTATLTPGTNLTQAVADPFVVWAEDHCSTLGFQARDYEGRARRQLEATQSYRIANELWLGTVAQGGTTLDNLWLTKDPEIVGAAALAPIPALALIDQALGQMLAGQRGMIHVSPNLLDQMDAGGGLTQSGQLWVTSMGNIIVADAGYPGTHPDGSSSTNQWIYATAMISYRLGELLVVPGSLDQARAEAMDRSVNLITVYAERLALLEWDTTIPVGNHSKHSVLAAETNVAAFAFAA